MNMKKKLMISGTTLVAAMTLGTVATAHAATYDEMEAKWEKIAPMNQGAGQWLDLESAASQGDTEAQKLMAQVDGKGSANSQKSTTNANTTSTTSATSTNVKSGQNAGAGNPAQYDLPNDWTGSESTQVATTTNSNATKSTPSASTTSTSVAPTTTTSTDNGMKILPQNGNDNAQAVAATGLGLATLAGMFGFGYMKKRA